MATPISPEYLARSGTEHGEQAALFCWAASERVQYPQLRWMFAIPNGGGRSMQQGAALKAEGVKGGVADVCLPVVIQYSPGLYIEMKRRTGVPSDVSKDQIDFAAFVVRQGYCWIPCFGWEQARAAVVTYLNAGEFQYDARQFKVLQHVQELVNAQNSQISTASH